MSTFKLGILLAIGVSLTGCDSKPNQLTPPLSPQPLASLLPLEINHLLINKNDPATEDRWTARLEWDASNCTIESSSTEITDRNCDGNFVHHFLDTLRTLQREGPAPDGPMERLGLEPPKFIIQLEGVPKISIGQDHYVRIGEDVPFLARGAALAMLDFLKNINVLRRRTLLNLDAFELTKIVITSGGSIKLSAKHQKNWGKFGPWVERMSHTQIKTFIDDPKAAQQALIELKAHPVYQTVLTNDRQNSVSLILGGQGRVLATVSTRPGAVFELYPETLLLFAQIPSHR